MISVISELTGKTLVDVVAEYSEVCLFSMLLLSLDRHLIFRAMIFVLCQILVLFEIFVLTMSGSLTNKRGRLTD